MRQIRRANVNEIPLDAENRCGPSAPVHRQNGTVSGKESIEVVTYV